MKIVNYLSTNKLNSVKSDSYKEIDECKSNKKKYKQTNIKFSKFNQRYYHAGDKYDIEKYGLLLLRYYYSVNSEKIKNKKINNLYEKINYESIKNTFEYIFEKFKKGIFVIIRNNKLIVFLPFSNYNYRNNWFDKIYFNHKEKKLLKNREYSSIKYYLINNSKKFEDDHPNSFKHYEILLDRSKWVANNCIFRNQYPIYEGERNINVHRYLLIQLLKERIVPDVEFFINVRDFPILKNNITEPYNHLFDSNSYKIEEKYKKNFCPIFSKSITNDFADILIPNEDDIKRISQEYFLDDCNNQYIGLTNHKWHNKKPVCIFRGSATGCGITLENNMRLKASDISVDNKDILDAGITDWNERPKKYMNQGIDIIDPKKFRFGLANKITNKEKSRYKYILNIDGHVSACRLSYELSMNSVILLVTSDYKLWFSDKLVAYKHYIPIASNLSDLIDKIKWCIANDSKCEQIAYNARIFYKKYLSKDGIFDYMLEQLTIIHSNKNYENLLYINPINRLNVAIITCYRNIEDDSRRIQKNLFIKLMKRLLKPICNYKIYIIEQSKDNNLFNIGKLKNIGFSIATDEYDYDNYIFIDIDTIPSHELLSYYSYALEYPISLAIRGTRYENCEISKPFLGAMLGFNKEQFTKINGYPNNFWGWGGEDDSLILRLIANDMKIYYPLNGSIIDLEDDSYYSQICIRDKLKKEKKNLMKYELLLNEIDIWKDNGINSLKYRIINKYIINNNIIRIKVDLQKENDNTNYSRLSVNEYKELKYKLYNIYKNLKILYI